MMTRSEFVPTLLITSEESGAILRVHPRTLANWRARGRGPRYIRIGRRPFYRMRDLEEWLDSHSFVTIAAEPAAARETGIGGRFRTTDRSAQKDASFSNSSTQPGKTGEQSHG
jgi:hypothetical protein